MKLTNLFFVFLLAACAEATNAAGQVNDGFVFPATGITVTGEATLLAIDDISLPLKNNLCFYLSKPKVRKEPVLTASKDPNAPDHTGPSFYGTVLFDNQKFRMWYYAIHPMPNPQPGQTRLPGEGDNIVQGPICYAESNDGISWTKPNLGQVLLNGSRSNNAIALPDTIAFEGVTVIKDETDPDPSRRYKMAYNEWSTKKGVAFTIRTATSSDGIHWTAGAELPLGTFIEHASFYKYNGFFSWVYRDQLYPSDNLLGVYASQRQEHKITLEKKRRVSFFHSEKYTEEAVESRTVSVKRICSLDLESDVWRIGICGRINIPEALMLARGLSKYMQDKKNYHSFSV